MASWQVQEARARFSDLMTAAAEHGPQTIMIRGSRAAVVLSADAYDRLSRTKPSLARFLKESPLAGVDLDLKRDRSAGRQVQPTPEPLPSSP